MNGYNNIFSANSKEQKKLIQQYEPLVNKITAQFVQKSKYGWNEIKSAAYEGLVLAFKQYDSTRSSMNFLQYAGFSIRNQILISLNNELRTVKMNYYNQKQAEQAGMPLFNTVAIDVYCDTDKDSHTKNNREVVLNIQTNENFSNGDVYEYLYYRLEAKFSSKDCDIFYRVFGLNGYDYEKSQDVAKLYNVSNGLVSQKVKKIINYIKGDEDLKEMLAQLMEI